MAFFDGERDGACSLCGFLEEVGGERDLRRAGRASAGCAGSGAQLGVTKEPLEGALCFPSEPMGGTTISSITLWSIPRSYHVPSIRLPPLPPRWNEFMIFNTANPKWYARIRTHYRGIALSRDGPGSEMETCKIIGLDP